MIMLPSRIIYGGHLFDTMGLIKLNNGSFLVLKNDEEVLSVDLSKTSDLNLNLPFEVKNATTVETVFVDYIMQAIKNDIKNGKFKDKIALRDAITDINRYVNTHKELLPNLKELDFKDDVVNKNIKQLFSYFDDVMKDAPLDFENISSFNVNGKNYIKYKDENNQIKILDDNVSNQNFVEQFKAKQNESLAFQQKDGEINSLEIANDMEKFEKNSIQLDDLEQLDNKDTLSSKAMQKYENEVVDDIVGNTETGIYYNKDDDKILTANNEGNKVVVNEVNETKATDSTSIEQNQNLEYPSYDNEIVTQFLVANRNKDINMDIFLNKYLENLSIDQINYILQNYPVNQNQFDMLTSQRNIKQNNNANELVYSESKQMENPKVKVLTLPNNGKTAAFIDTLLLSFIVGIVSGIYLTLLILTILS